MKKIIFIVSLLASTSAFAIGSDGCYLMYTKGVVYPSFCISGSAEEGIGGSNAKLVLFHVNSDQPDKCYKTSKISVDSSDNMAIEIDGNVEMTLSLKSTSEKGLRSGDVTVGKTELKYQELDQMTTQRFVENISVSQICQ